jgi:hypothetical protein
MNVPCEFVTIETFLAESGIVMVEGYQSKVDTSTLQV